MANFAGSFQSPYSSPYFIFDIGYSQTNRWGGGASYSVSVGVRMSSSYSSFGYSLAGTVTIGNSSQRIVFKGNETWSGTGTHWFTFNLSPTGIGDGGGQIGASFVTDRPGGEGNAGKISLTGYTVDVSTWNTAPTLSGTIRANSNQADLYIPENQSTIALDWNDPYVSSHDNEGGSLWYKLYREVNQNGVWTRLYDDGGRSYTDNIGTGNQGQQIRYRLSVNDASEAYSGYVYSYLITKNTMTKATLFAGGKIVYLASGTANYSISVSGASNTNGNTTFTYALTSPQLTIYNASGLTSAPTTITLYSSGTVPTTPYIKLSDLKTLYASSGYKGTLSIILTTTNAYGSSGTSSATMDVDITTAPSTFASAVTTSGTYTIGGTGYYIPNRKAIVVSWGACTDVLTSGGTIKYDVQVSYDGGSTYSDLATDLTTNTYSAALSKVNAATSCKFNVIAKTTYGTTRSLALVTPITLHYYDVPTIVFDRDIRTSTTSTVKGTVYINSSITGLTVNTPLQFTTSGDKVMTATTLTVTNGTNRAFFTTVVSGNTTITGLTAAMKFNFNISVNDIAGTAIGTPATSGTLSIKSYYPALDISQYGVGVNALSGLPYALTVGGEIRADNSMTFNNDMSVYPQLVGDYSVNGQKDKMIWTIGRGWMTWANHYGLAYEWDLVNGNNDHLITIRGNGVTKFKFGMTSGNAEFAGNIVVGGVAATPTAGVANSIVKRDANGYINSSWFNSNRGDETTAAASYIFDKGDGYLRKKTLANARAEVGGTPGEVSHFARTTAPPGWIKANGAILSRTTYADLFAAIGTTWGAGDGSTTFQLPDMRGYFIRSWSDGRDYDTGRPFGSFRGGGAQLSGAEAQGYGLVPPGSPSGFANRVYVNTGQDAEGAPSNLALLACIKY